MVATSQRIRPPEKQNTLPKPPWLRVRAPSGVVFERTHSEIKDQRLTTVCEEAACPNIGEYWPKSVLLQTFSQGAALVFAQGTHHLEPFNGRICGLSRFEAAHRLDQLFKLSVICLDHVVQVLDLAVLNIFWALAFILQFADRLGIAPSLVGIDFIGFSQSLQARRAFPRKRLAALALRVEDR